jgi:hypothetical protein
MIVYTAIFGHYDKLFPPTVVNPDFGYYCVSENGCSAPEPWQTATRQLKGNLRRSARYYKINSHLTFPNTDLSIWHGGNVQLTCDPIDLVNLMGDADILVFRHSLRGGVYEEAAACMLWKVGSHNRIQRQIDRYKAEHFPDRNLYMAFLIVRRHTDHIAHFNELWWDEVAHGSARDQISLPYALWKSGVKPKVIKGGDHRRGPYWIRRHHIRHPRHSH